MARERLLCGPIAGGPALIEIAQQPRRDARLGREAGAEQQQVDHRVDVALSDAALERRRWPASHAGHLCRTLGRREWPRSDSGSASSSRSTMGWASRPGDRATAVAGGSRCRAAGLRLADGERSTTSAAATTRAAEAGLGA